MIHILLVCNNQQLLFISVPKWLLHHQSHQVVQCITYIYEHRILCYALDQFTTRSLWCVRVVRCHIASLWHNCSYMRANSSCGSQVRLHRFPSNLDLGCFFGSNPSHILPFHLCVTSVPLWLHDSVSLPSCTLFPLKGCPGYAAFRPSKRMSNNPLPILLCQLKLQWLLTCQLPKIFISYLLRASYAKNYSYSSGTCSEIRGSCIADHWWSSKSLP